MNSYDMIIKRFQFYIKFKERVTGDGVLWSNGCLDFLSVSFSLCLHLWHCPLVLLEDLNRLK